MIITKTQLEKWVKIPKNIYELTNEHITEVDSFTSQYVEATGLVTGYVVSRENIQTLIHYLLLK